MDELVTIIEERRQSLSKLKQSNEKKHKSVLIQQQRKRNQRQNWILRVLKTLKMLSLEQKKIIYQTSIKIMNFHQSMECKVTDFQGVNFIEVFINLFVEFYNKFEEMDLSHIKTIIRPNNSYIIVDLIKTLVELGRKQFKVCIQEMYKEIVPIRNDRRYFMLNSKTEGSKSQLISREEENMKSTNSKFQENFIEIHKKITVSLYQKYSRSIQFYNPEACHERFNELYFDLMYSNRNNSSKIQKFMDRCFGAKRHILYDASGLYTQDQIKKMQNQHNQKARNINMQIKELKGICTSEQLKEYFKIKVQMHSTLNSLPSMVKNPAIRPWFPIKMIKNGDKLHPYNQTIETNGILHEIFEFQEKNNKKLKVYMKQLLNEEFEHKLNKSENLDMTLFNKKEYLDFNNAKILELLNKDAPKVYKIDKQKETILPPISIISNSKNFSGIKTLRTISKVQSEGKLPKTNNAMSSKIGAQSLGQILERRMNHSSVYKEKNPSRRKMDNLIDTLIRPRQYTLN